jgi:hypothetical protein
MAAAVSPSTIREDILTKYKNLNNPEQQRSIQEETNNLFLSRPSLAGLIGGNVFDRRLIALIRKEPYHPYDYTSLENRVTDAAFLAGNKLSSGMRFLLWFVWLFSCDAYVNIVLNIFKGELKHNDAEVYNQAFE